MPLADCMDGMASGRARVARGEPRERGNADAQVDELLGELREFRPVKKARGTLLLQHASDVLAPRERETLLRSVHAPDIALVKEGGGEPVASLKGGEGADEVGTHEGVRDERQTLIEKVALEEAQILRELAARPALLTVKERAADIQYKEPMRAYWKAPRCVRRLSQQEMDRRRARAGVELVNDDQSNYGNHDHDHLALPPLCISFREMKFPRALVEALRDRNVHSPTRVQMQAIPAALSGRNFIAVASTGGGKTLAFGIPVLCIVWNMNLALRVERKEGPFALILAPSRELAKQTFDVLSSLAESIDRYSARPPRLRGVLLVGGMPLGEQLQPLRESGCHFAVGTPGRLHDALKRKQMTLEACRLLVLDEADRLIDTNFEQDTRNILDFFVAQRQTLMFSATMAPKLAQFASSSMVAPLRILADRAGVAGRTISQHVMVLESEAEFMPALLLAIQATAPPVLIFSDSPRVVDDVHLFLLEHGMRACCVHGGLDQHERNVAMAKFRAGEKDVLVASDVAAKGLDFERIRHVINVGLPREIENYVHRIGRTGRAGKKGRATTLLCVASCSSGVLRDLVELLVQAHQPVPAALQPFNTSLEDTTRAHVNQVLPGLSGGHLDDDVHLDAHTDAQLAKEEINGVRGCAYCGGLGHRIARCERLQQLVALAERANAPAAHQRTDQLGDF
ncbi:putative DEAD-box ATP-dependent RNA helicase 43 [Porphyridium purpureum]|uniref:RNA helicase n=1 Tax=Porphyridium purpureum TaxID=35688 RepID=A0A5J4YK29_PORPP|nr:putative DEAD-box ATP-dependent RNA helicase 43 [Porphyridium purpureum]|eukprot:POR5876..scf251_18